MDIIGTTQELMYIILTGVLIAMIIVAIFMVRSLLKYTELKQIRLSKEIEYKELEEENRNRTAEYSNSILEMIRNMLAQIAILKYRTFQDNHDMTKINKTILESLVRDVAETAHRSLNGNIFSFEDTFFTQEYYEKYIAETSAALIKQMWEKDIEEHEEI